MSYGRDDQDVVTAANSERGFEGHLHPGKRPALLVVDFVKAYLLPRSPLCAPVESARSICEGLLALARERKLLVLHTTVSYHPGGANGGVFYRKLPALRCFEQGVDPELTEFATGLQPSAAEVVITKQYASAFFGTSLASILTANRIDTLLIAGVSTSGCVRATAVDCCQHGFIPVVVRDAVGDRCQASHDANLFDIQAKYGEVLTMQRIERYLSETALEASDTPR